jgi:hypothetical protein
MSETGPLPAFPSLEESAPHLAGRTGAAIKRRFDRKLYPPEYLIHVTPKRLAVDLHGLVAWLRAKNAAKENV